MIGMMVVGVITFGFILGNIGDAYHVWNKMVSGINRKLRRLDDWLSLM